MDVVNLTVANSPEEIEGLEQQDKIMFGLLDRLNTAVGKERAKEIAIVATNHTHMLHNKATERTATGYETFSTMNYVMLGHLLEAVLYAEQEAGSDGRAENTINALFGDEQVLTEITREDALRVAKILAAR
jgi:hypothetical protein